MFLRLSVILLISVNHKPTHKRTIFLVAAFTKSNELKREFLIIIEFQLKTSLFYYMDLFSSLFQMFFLKQQMNCCFSNFHLEFPSTKDSSNWHLLGLQNWKQLLILLNFGYCCKHTHRTNHLHGSPIKNIRYIFRWYQRTFTKKKMGL